MVSHVANLGLARCVTEADVEQNQILPLLSASEWMNVPLDDIKNKHYMPQRDIGKGANIKRSYIPDFAIWIDSIPVLIVEAKSPAEDAAKGFSEGRLYAHAINANYPSGINPIRFVISMNGQSMILGYWDSIDPIIATDVRELKIGTRAHDTMIEAVSFEALKRHASDMRLKFKPIYSFTPLYFIGGDPVANRKIPFNSFANDLVPLIRKYFESDSPEGIDDIIQRAYVSSDEITKYDAILETSLKENISHLQMPSAKSIETTKTKEHTLTPQLRRFSHNLPHTGHIQLIIGSVGSGKSLFTQRYYRYLQPSDVSDSSLWAFIDFNRAPDDLSGADAWLCAEFVESIAKENPSLDLEGNARAVFAPNIQKLRKLYGDAVKSAPAIFELEVARELVKLTDDPVVYAKAVCRYIIGDKRKAIICVIDNVDRRDRDQQLRIFQITQWFRSETRTFCILALRDETYERYKGEPPLDAFSNAIHFTITPPRFINVVKKRLDLCLEYLIDQSPERRSYQVTDGITISYPKSKLGNLFEDVVY